MFPRRKRAPSKAAFQAVLFEMGVQELFSIFLSQNRDCTFIVFPAPAGLPSTHVPDRRTQLETERDRFIRKRLERSLTGRIVTGHPVEWSMGGGQRVLR